jgi:hypothetical protein
MTARAAGQAMVPDGVVTGGKAGTGAAGASRCCRQPGAGGGSRCCRQPGAGGGSRCCRQPGAGGGSRCCRQPGAGGVSRCCRQPGAGGVSRCCRQPGAGGGSRCCRQPGARDVSGRPRSPGAARPPCSPPVCAAPRLVPRLPLLFHYCAMTQVREYRPDGQRSAVRRDPRPRRADAAGTALAAQARRKDGQAPRPPRGSRSAGMSRSCSTASRTIMTRFGSSTR